MVLVAAAGCLASMLTAPSSAPFAAGTLNLQGTLRLVSDPLICPPEAPPNADCLARTAQGKISGLGSVSANYTWSFRMGPPTCPASDVGKPLATTGRLVIVGKGEIQFALADGARCVDLHQVRNEPQDFTIIGGTGTYEGMSGSGKLWTAVSGGGDLGRVTWSGTVAVPGLDFDLTPPVLKGARNKVVKAKRPAKRAAVRYAVTAQDAVDGSVPAVCDPPSGSRFKIGKTTVRCSATDSSANTATASFVVRVSRG